MALYSQNGAFYRKSFLTKSVPLVLDHNYRGFFEMVFSENCPKKGSPLGSILLHKTPQSPIGLLGPYIDFLLILCAYIMYFDPLELLF